MAQKIDKLTQAYEKYAPKNITLQQYAELVAQDPGLLHAPFSTVNPALAKLTKSYKNKYISAEHFRKILRQEVKDDTMERVAKKYAKIYENIICSDINILRGAWNFKGLNEQERTDLARKIIQQINEYFGINTQLNITYNDKYETEMYPDANRSKISSLINKFLKKLKLKKNKLWCPWDV